jgi:hypothetical protein
MISRTLDHVGLYAPDLAGLEAMAGLGRILALYHRSSALSRNR